jgi:hypothetical protein
VMPRKTIAAQTTKNSTNTGGRGRIFLLEDLLGINIVCG